MTTHTVKLTGEPQRARAAMLLASAPIGAVVTIQEAGEARTKSQNRLAHMWFAEISRHHSFGQSPADVKAQCNLTYGLPILTRDDVGWGAAFGYIFSALDRPTKLKAIRVLDIPFTRNMVKDQLTEYLEQMRQDYAEQGVHLTDPDDQGRTQR